MSNQRRFRYFKTSPEINRLAVMMYVRDPLSLRNVEDLVHERRLDITHETARVCWGRLIISRNAASRRALADSLAGSACFAR